MDAEIVSSALQALMGDFEHLARAPFRLSCVRLVRANVQVPLLDFPPRVRPSGSSLWRPCAFEAAALPVGSVEEFGDEALTEYRFFVCPHVPESPDHITLLPTFERLSLRADRLLSAAPDRFRLLCAAAINPDSAPLDWLDVLLRSARQGAIPDVVVTRHLWDAHNRPMPHDVACLAQLAGHNGGRTRSQRILGAELQRYHQSYMPDLFAASASCLRCILAAKAEAPAGPQDGSPRTLDSPWMDYEEVALYIGVAVGTVRNWVSEKFIPHSRRQGVVRFHREKVDAWLSRNACKGRVRRAGS